MPQKKGKQMSWARPASAETGIARDAPSRKGGSMVPASAVARLANLLSDKPSPQFWAYVNEVLSELLTQLRDPQLQQIAICCLDGTPVHEIAARCGCCHATVERKLRRIEHLWSEIRHQ
jgi:DNA-binding NarL/FixJ family response regulator